MAQHTSPEDLEKLRAEVARLTAALADETEKRTVAEENAHKLASSQGLAMLTSNVEEIPTGKSVKLKVAKNPWVKDAKELEFEEREFATYFYKIDLPASGGVDIKLNGVSYYHGETYTVDLALLRTLKDIVHRCWAHEQSIRGSNENAYRKPANTILRGGARQTRH